MHKDILFGWMFTAASTEQFKVESPADVELGVFFSVVKPLMLAGVRPA
jgi:hypothetical protein